MEFGWINLFGGSLVALMLAPNIVYALRHRDRQNRCRNRFMNVLEQVGRYACIVLMWLPLLVWKFGFKSVGEMLAYFLGNGVLLTVYWAVYALYLRRETPRRAVILAVAPACIFLMSGVLLRHWLLAAFAVLFAVGHIYVTVKNLDPGSKA